MIKLTEDLLRSMYDMLTHTEPFNKWNLPDSEDVNFKVMSHKTAYGYYVFEDDGHTIMLSRDWNGLLGTAINTMAHEMIHMHQRHSCVKSSNKSVHDAAFKKLAAEVCAIHGFDPKAF